MTTNVQKAKKTSTRTQKTATVRARIEPSVKEQAESVLRQIGISPSEAINVFYKRIASEQAFPFSLNVPNAETRKAMKEMEQGKNLHRFESTDELFEWLDS